MTNLTLRWTTMTTKDRLLTIVSYLILTTVTTTTMKRKRKPLEISVNKPGTQSCKRQA